MSCLHSYLISALPLWHVASQDLLLGGSLWLVQGWLSCFSCHVPPCPVDRKPLSSCHFSARNIFPPLHARPRQLLLCPVLCAEEMLGSANVLVEETCSSLSMLCRCFVVQCSAVGAAASSRPRAVPVAEPGPGHHWLVGLSVEEKAALMGVLTSGCPFLPLLDTSSAFSTCFYVIVVDSPHPRD